MSNETPEASCDFCAVTAALPSVPARERLYVGPGWRVRAHRSALPGWTLVIPKRHITSLDELSDDEAIELGLILRDLTAVYVQELGALKSYVQQFAEGTPHAHFSVTPRMADLPPERLGAKASLYNSADEPLSESERDDIAIRLADAWPRGAHTHDVVFARAEVAS
jgi:diadenosine tetraphosphate (Ap4A) HIT family hydrolase